MENLTLAPALTGGMLIGLAASLLLVLNGRIAGISGILGGVLSGRWNDAGWRVAFLGGLVLGTALHAWTVEPTAVSMVVPLPWLAAGGVLVGFGTRLGSGCTSGHGVCGIGRLSRRSFAATITFLTSGALTVFVVRHVLAG